MSITERVMAAGSWDLQLVEDSPRWLMEAIDVEASAFGQLVILPVHLDPRNHTDAGMLAVARYSGIYRRQEGDFRLSGVGAAILLGDEDNKGDIFETDRSTTNGWLTEWVTALRPMSLAAGTTYSPGGSYDGTFFLVTAKEAFETLSTAFDVEWRVTPDFKLDVGHPDDLYGTTPALMVLHNAGDGGRDLSPLPDDLANVTPLVGVPTTDAGWNRDYEDYTTKVVYVTEQTTTTNTEVVTEEGSPTYTWDENLGSDVVTDIGTSTTDTITETSTETVVTTAATAGVDVPFGRPSDGAEVILDRLINASTDDGSTPQRMANVQLGRFDTVRRELFVDGGKIDIGHLAPVGSPVWLYAPPLVMDTAAPVQFRGRTCYPVQTRIVGMTWPIQKGCGVYLRVWRGAATPTWHDLTDFVVWEDGDTKLEVGALPRPSSD